MSKEKWAFVRTMIIMFFILCVIIATIMGVIHDHNHIQKVVVTYIDGSKETITISSSVMVKMENGCVYYGTGNYVRCGARSFYTYEEEIK